MNQLNKIASKQGQAKVCSMVATSLTIGIISFVFCAPVKGQQFSSNRLAVGSQSKVAQCQLTINQPSDLNFKSKAEIQESRRRFVYEHPELLCYQYTPTPSVFDGIEDGKPWWGLEGEMFYGSGDKSILGAAEESRFLNNPFILVAANIRVSRYAYKDNKYSDLDDFARRSGVPLCLMPQQATIYPQQNREEITYKVADWLNNLERIMETKFKLEEAPFDLVAYNARDLGYNFIQVDNRYSKGLSRSGESPIAITQFLHCGGSCGYSGGCNNMSPAVTELDNFHLIGLPARSVVYLWRQKPASNTPADFMVVINFI